MIYNYAILVTSNLVKLGLKPLFLIYLFLDFILNTLTLAHLNCSTALSSTFEPSTVGVPTFVSFHSSSETNKASTISFLPTSTSCFLTSIISPFLTIN
jgi:hypothetical protein